MLATMSLRMKASCPRCWRGGDDVGMDDAVRAFVDAIDPAHRPLFDRIHGLILQAHPDASVGLSYQMPTYRVGSSRLYVGVWKHGLSLYGWKQDGDGGV